VGGRVGLLELFVAVLIVGLSAVNAALPFAAWGRLGDPRFLLLGGASAVLLLLGALWTWGQLPYDPPAYTAAQLPILLLALIVAMLLLAATLVPRRR
jgi:hypothetical protein